MLLISGEDIGVEGEGARCSDETEYKEPGIEEKDERSKGWREGSLRGRQEAWQETAGQETAGQDNGDCIEVTGCQERRDSQDEPKWMQGPPYSDEEYDTDLEDDFPEGTT